MNAERPLQERTWPPLIKAATVPRWMRLRDAVLTLTMWVLFVIILQAEVVAFVGEFLESLGLINVDTGRDWDAFFRHLLPFLEAAAGLVAAFLTTVPFTLRRGYRGLKLPQPVPLPLADEAVRAGMAAADLTAARGLRIAVVHFEPDGRHRVVPR